MVGAEEVVVDRLGHAHHTALVADGLHVLVDLVAGVHGVVAAVIEEVADIVLAEHLEDALIVGVVLGGIGDFIAAGAERGGGRILQQRQLLGILQPHIKQAVVQHALDAVLRAEHLRDGAGLERRVDHAVCAGIDDGRGAAGLADDTCAFQLFHKSYLRRRVFSNLPNYSTMNRGQSKRPGLAKIEKYATISHRKAIRPIDQS